MVSVPGVFNKNALGATKGYQSRWLDVRLRWIPEDLGWRAFNYSGCSIAITKCPCLPKKILKIKSTKQPKKTLRGWPLGWCSLLVESKLPRASRLFTTPPQHFGWQKTNRWLFFGTLNLWCWMEERRNRSCRTLDSGGDSRVTCSPASTPDSLWFDFFFKDDSKHLWSTTLIDSFP